VTRTKFGPRALTALAAIGLFAAFAPQAVGQAIDLSSGGPVEVTARGGFEWRDAEHVVIAEGDARAVRGEVTVLADRLLAFYRKKPGTAPAPASTNAASPAGGLLGVGDGGENEIFRLEAQGHVRIFTKTDEAVGDKAVYDMDQAVMVMTGHALKLTTPQEVMTARDSLEYWAQKRMAVARGEAVVVTADARRLAADVLVAYLAPPEAAPAKAASASPAPAGAPDAAGKLEKVEAFGNVDVRTTTDTVRGDRGVYVAATGIARVVGHVRITHGQNQINGPAADVNMQTGVAHILAGEGARVEGLIVPEDAKKAVTPPSAAPTPATPGVTKP
jgi:lipopolysaccharide export system protein LptA